MKLQTTNYKKQTNKGFSMIELLVTIAILTIVSGIVFFNHSQFNNNVLIGNLAYEISLAIRQAQSYGVQVKEVEGSFDKGYGVYFNITSNDEFLIFADTFPAGSPNFIYDSGSSKDKIIDNLKMTNGNYVSKLCVTSSGSKDCSVSNISISFLRPDPDAKIYTSNGGGPYDSIDIYIISPKGEQKMVSVNSVGQISVHSI